MKKLPYLFLFIAAFTISVAQNKDSLLAIAKKTPADSNSVNAYIKLSKLVMPVDMKLSEEYAANARATAEKINFFKGAGDALMQSAVVCFSSGRLEDAYKNFLLANNKYDKGKLTGRAARALNNAAYAQYSMGNYEKSLELYQKALKGFEAIKDYPAISTCIEGISAIYYSFKNYDKMLEYYYYGLKVFRDAGDTARLASIYNALSVAYTEKNNLDSVYICLKKSYDLYSLIKDEQSKGFILNNFGRYYVARKDFAKAEESYQKARDINLAVNDLKQLSFSLEGLGELSLQKKEYKQALQYYKESMDLQEKLKLHTYMIKKFYKMGIVSDSLKDYKQAVNYYNQGLTAAKETGQKDLIMNYYNGLAFAYKGMKDYGKALEYFELWSSEKDSIFNKESRDNVNEMTAKYETEKKQLLIDNLEKEKTIQKAEIKSANTQKIALATGLILMLGLAIVMIRSYRQKRNANLLLTEKNNLIENQKNEVTHQKEIIEEKQKEIVDSINYAKRIQYSLLANKNFVTEHIPENFIYFKPKDIVSGDFYWATLHNGKFYIAACDSTGHGVPGAFMSLLNIGFLSEAINEKNIAEPNKVLDYVRERLVNSISKEGQKDGFDGILLCIDKKNKEISYAAAHNAPLLISGESVTYLETNKMPVGMGEKNEPFNLHKINMKPGDTLYLYTDGYADQFGGPKGKKLMYKKLNEMLFSAKDLPLKKQAEELDRQFQEWKGDLEQVDDVLVIGMRI